MDPTTLLLEAHNLVARKNETSSSHNDKANRPPVFKVVGLILAVTSGIFIGVSFVLKKKGLLKANVKYNEEAGEGYGYLKNAWWWTGMTLMIIGEICNFVAYAFVDAILVTPLGALAVVVTTILSAIFLKERLSFVGKVGCFNCIIGSVVIVINAPEQSAVATIQDMKKLVLAPGFLVYMSIILAGCVAVALFVAPKYGKKSMLVYLTICSLIGGLSVVCTQGLGAAIVSQIQGTPQFNQWFLYIVLVFVICTLVTEIIYLNKALNLFNAALVTPTYYVFFTSATIVTSAVLFQGFKGTPASIATVIMGFLQICSGVILLQLSKSAKDVPDATVFKGDLDQVRTVAEQEEPEYEPRADTIRGGGALLRSISKARTNRQKKEAKKLHDEYTEPINENEAVEWDGLRRRKTVLSSEGGPTPQRTRTIHPPLGMSHFPDDDDDDRASNVTDMHPGIFPWRRRSRGASNATATTAVQMDAMKTGPDATGTTPSSRSPHIFGLPIGLRRVSQVDGEDDAQDTAYHGAPHIHFADEVGQERAKSAASTLSPPPVPPPHSTKRQFSFQDIFHRGNRASSGSHADASSRPTSSSGPRITSGSRFRRTSGNANTAETEEERLGLVQGDSRTLLGGPLERSPSPPPKYPESEEEDWDRYELDKEGQRDGASDAQQQGLGISVQGVTPTRASHAPLPPLPPEAARDGGDHDANDNTHARV